MGVGRWAVAAGVIGGLAAGACVGSAFANPYYGGGYYGGGYPAYGYGYGPGLRLWARSATAMRPAYAVRSRVTPATGLRCAAAEGSATPTAAAGSVACRSASYQTFYATTSRRPRGRRFHLCRPYSKLLTPLVENPP